jgi:hypothetical protein
VVRATAFEVVAKTITAARVTGTQSLRRLFILGTASL